MVTAEDNCQKMATDEPKNHIITVTLNLEKQIKLVPVAYS